jgi:negative regulator of sigma E activity
MVFKRKESFFLDLGSEGSKPVKVAVAESKPAAQKPAAKGKPDAKASQAVTAVAPAAPVALAASGETAAPGETAASSAPALTTAEAIAAELRAAQEALPPPSNATFAPDCLNPANALRSRRRLAGANLAGFKDMASGMFRN